jgi:hypothetical protein
MLDRNKGSFIPVSCSKPCVLPRIRVLLLMTTTFNLSIPHRVDHVCTAQLRLSARGDVGVPAGGVRTIARSFLLNITRMLTSTLAILFALLVT